MGWQQWSAVAVVIGGGIVLQTRAMTTPRWITRPWVRVRCRQAWPRSKALTPRWRSTSPA